ALRALAAISRLLALGSISTIDGYLYNMSTTLLLRVGARSGSWDALEAEKYPESTLGALYTQEHVHWSLLPTGVIRELTSGNLVMETCRTTNSAITWKVLIEAVIEATGNPRPRTRRMQWQCDVQHGDLKISDMYHCGSNFGLGRTCESSRDQYLSRTRISREILTLQKHLIFKDSSPVILIFKLRTKAYRDYERSSLAFALHIFTGKSWKALAAALSLR
ncbi:hypothetical protein IAQ61_010238, partial [Plenodomus lingam]|uniref:uncharacterized protein n=1 Tax=Leptosphaeria maculans TaxID=5022 RepID=UPI003323BE58